MISIYLILVLLCLAVLIFCDNSNKYYDGVDLLGSDKMVNRGKDTLEKYEQKGSPCWSKAVMELKHRCGEMSDIEQSILAMKFANCHFEKSGMQTYDCTSIDTFKECTNAMKANDPTSFIVYTDFFTHVTDMCYFLQSGIWRNKTAMMIDKLSSTSEEAVARLEESLSNQNMVLKGQKMSLQNQKEIMKHEERLQHALENSTASAKFAFDEMKQRADEQKAIFSSTFDGIFAVVDKLAHLQSMLLGEFIGLQSLAFYFITIVACYFFTSTPQTSRARLFVLMAFSLLVLIERVIVKNAFQAKNISNATAETVHERVWFARKVFIGVSLFVLGYMASTYRDLNNINNKILKEIQLQILEIYEMEKTKQLQLHPSKISDAKLQSSLSESKNNAEISHISMSTSTPQKLQSALTRLFERFPRSPFKNSVSNLSNEDCPDAGVVTLEDSGDAPSRGRKDVLFSDDENKEPKKKNKLFSKKNFIKKKQKLKMETKSGKEMEAEVDGMLSIKTATSAGRYNLRRRSGTPLSTLGHSAMSVPDCSSTKAANKKRKANKGNDVHRKGLFSSDDED